MGVGNPQTEGPLYLVAHSAYLAIASGRSAYSGVLKNAVTIFKASRPKYVCFSFIRSLDCYSISIIQGGNNAYEPLNISYHQP